jgi:U3 small nucleolar RNA-associated protein 14
MREEDIEKTEELKMNHLSVEEVANRRAELRKMRELMFRADVKAKRIAKIKSKTFRRIKKRERERLATKPGDGDLMDDEHERTKRETERAKERATLKHKNTGKWAKAMRARGELDEDQRRDINEMLDRGERLKRRVQGIASDDDDDGSDSEGEQNVDGIKTSAFEELARLNDDSVAEAEHEPKSVFNMKFMKDAAARQALESHHMAEDFIKEMGARGSDGEAPETLESTAVSVKRTGGRFSFRPGDSVRGLGLKYE